MAPPRWHHPPLPGDLRCRCGPPLSPIEMLPTNQGAGRPASLLPFILLTEILESVTQRNQKEVNYVKYMWVMKM